MTWILPGMGMLMYAVLALVTFGSILAKTPFTLQYAREMVDRALWENPVFNRVNVLMTGFWGESCDQSHHELSHLRFPADCRMDYFAPDVPCSHSRYRLRHPVTPASAEKTFYGIRSWGYVTQAGSEILLPSCHQRLSSQ